MNPPLVDTVRREFVRRHLAFASNELSNVAWSLVVLRAMTPEVGNQ